MRLREPLIYRRASFDGGGKFQAKSSTVHLKLHKSFNTGRTTVFNCSRSERAPKRRWRNTDTKAIHELGVWEMHPPY